MLASLSLPGLLWLHNICSKAKNGHCFLIHLGFVADDELCFNSSTFLNYLWHSSLVIFHFIAASFIFSPFLSSFVCVVSLLGF